MNAWKHILLIGALLCLVVVTASAATINDTVTVEDVTIGMHWGIDVTYEGAAPLEFKQGTNPDAPTEPHASGDYYTQWAYVDVDCNHDVDITLEVTQLTDTSGTYTLKTDVQYKYRKINLDGTWTAWTLVGPVWMPPTSSPYSRTWSFTHGSGFYGYFELELRMSVHRNGVADHSGTYSSTITVTLS